MFRPNTIRCSRVWPAKGRLSAQKQLKMGVGILKVAKMVGLGTGTVHRIEQEMGAV
jgi:hypothetical protein